jgi:hypothetical protein
MNESAMTIAVEARERARSAEKRLDGINGQIARGNDKLDAIDAKVTSILITLAKEDGGRTASRGLIDNAKFVVTAGLIVLTSAVGAAVLSWILRSHA